MVSSLLILFSVRIVLVVGAPGADAGGGMECVGESFALAELVAAAHQRHRSGHDRRRLRRRVKTQGAVAAWARDSCRPTHRY